MEANGCSGSFGGQAQGFEHALLLVLLDGLSFRGGTVHVRRRFLLGVPSQIAAILPSANRRIERVAEVV